MKLTVTPIDYDYFDYDNQNYAKIIARTPNGKRVCLIDTCDTYFWAIVKEHTTKKEIEAISKKILKLTVVKNARTSFVTKITVEKKQFLGKPVTALKIFVSNYKDAHDIASQIDFKEIEKRRGYDLGFITQYIIERGMKPFLTYEVSGEVVDALAFDQVTMGLKVDTTIHVKSLEEKKGDVFSPRVLAYDIETEAFEIGKGAISMISLYGNNFQKVLTWKKESKQPFVEHYTSEEAMLKAFVKEVHAYNPDVLTGYFSDGFDLPYLRTRADTLKVDLALGLDSSKPTFSRGRLTTGKIKGIVHVDILRFIRNAYSQYLQSETLSLDDVSEELLGEKKVPFDAFKAMHAKHVDWETFYTYNLKDSELTYKLYEKIWPDLLEITKVTQEPLFTTSRLTMASSFESYVLHNLSLFNEIPEKNPTNEDIGARRMDRRYEGGFVYQPTPGLYENIMFFDFSSMYGSVTVSYNLSRGTLSASKVKGGYVGDYNGKSVYFEKKEGFLPHLLREIIDKRRLAKEAYQKNPSPILRARSNAFKLIANAAYGYQGFFGARYYSIEAAASTAFFARENIKKAIATFEKRGFTIIYGDTDSVAITLGNKTKKDALEVLQEINKNLPGIMELELEGLFHRGIWVTKRGGDSGAKKKYALIDDKKTLRIRGFETVRRDWCNLARKLQSDILQSILENGNEKKAQEIFLKVVKAIKERTVPLDDVIIRTKLKKSMNDYIAQGPHVIAAKKMIAAKTPVSVGSLISYYVAEGKGKRVGDKVKLPDEEGLYDIDYYLHNQILPSVENIFDVFSLNTTELINGHTQKGLGDF